MLGENKEPQWKELFRMPTIFRTAVASQNPSRGMCLTSKNGPMQVHRWDVTTGEVKRVNDLNHGTFSGWISPDGNWIYYMNDRDGAEVGHIVRVSFEGGEVQDLTPDLEPYASLEFLLSVDCAKVHLIAANSSGFGLYEVPLNDNGCGDYRLVTPIENELCCLTGNPKSDILAYSTSNNGLSKEMHVRVFDTATSGVIAELHAEEGYNYYASLHSPLDGDSRMVVHSDRSGYLRPVVWDYKTSELDDLSIKLKGEIYLCDWSSDGEDLLLCHTEKAVKQLYLYNLQTRMLQSVKHPSGTVCFFFTSDCYFVGDKIYVQWQSSNAAAQILAFDRKSGECLQPVLQLSEQMELPKWESFTFNSSDGEDIQGWLVTPKGEGPFPTILHTHGGPEWVMTELFAPKSQMWVENGFAFVTINFRGSTTFGKKFCEKIRGDLGHWEIEDMVAAREWLIARGVTHPDKVIAAGGSYGGYNTLMALSKYPDLWAGGLADVAIADWQGTYEDSAETLKAYFQLLFGGKDEGFEERLKKSSPATYIESVTKPILIIQGRSDSRTPARQVVEYEKAMKAAGKDITVHWFDSGHIGGDNEEEIAHAELRLEYAKRFLGI